MERVLSERHKRAEGAREEAEKSRELVQDKLRTYNDALRKARGEMFLSQEAARREVLEEKQTAVQAARAAAQRELQVAKQALASEVVAARTVLEQSSGDLASDIAAAILDGEPVDPNVPVAGGAQ